MQDKYALVTGASTGIGRSISVELGKNGCHVFLVSRNGNKLQETKTLVENAGGKAAIITADLSKTSSASEILNKIKEVTEKLDYLFNIAGIWHGNDEVYAGKDFESFSDQVVLDTFNVGLVTPSLLVKLLIPLMDKRTSIVNLSGTFENGAKGWLPYYVSKRGIEDLTIGLSEELKDKGINVNCVSPSDTATEEYKKYFPEDAEGAQTPEQIATVAVKLAKSDSTGKIIVVKGGNEEEKFHS